MSDHEIEHVHGELVLAESAPPTLFGTSDPVEVVKEATRVATALADVIEQKQLFKMISQKKHVRVEGWLLLGAMLGVFPQTEWTRAVTDSNGNFGYEASVVARTRDGAVVGRREAMCTRSEARWKGADDYAIRSMAQTRAVSGALSGPLRFVMELGGYSGTPEEEMPSEGRTAASSGKSAATPRLANSWAEWTAKMGEVGVPADDSRVWLAQASEGLDKQSDSGKADLFRRANAVLATLAGIGTDLAFQTGVRSVIAQAFAQAFNGVTPDGPEWRLGPDEADRPLREGTSSAPIDLTPEEQEAMNEADSIPFGEA